jgi:hypothetical protein
MNDPANRMKPLSSTAEKFLLALAVFGFIGPNGCFVYFALSDFGTVLEALRNPIALVFITEAFALMFLIAWLLHHWGWRRPGWGWFVVLSLLGSLLFSVPLYLYLASRAARSTPAP